MRLGQFINDVLGGGREAYERAIESLQAENAALRRAAKNLERQLSVQRARTGDQKALVKLLKVRLKEYEGGDPVINARRAASQNPPRRDAQGRTRHEAMLARRKNLNARLRAKKSTPHQTGENHD